MHSQGWRDGDAIAPRHGWRAVHTPKTLPHLVHPTMHLSPIGQTVKQCWLALPEHFEHIRLDEMIIMPDHVHAIIVIARASARPATSTNGTRPSSLPAIVQNFKSISTRRVNQLRNESGGSLWQRNYYERIIHDQKALEHMREYIRTNPSR